MTGNKKAATWFLFTTLLSIFNICTIRIFDGYNWPFYAVTANAILSLGGLAFHMHADKAARKLLVARIVRILLLLNSISVFVMLGFSLFILTSQYHNPQVPDKTVSSAAEVEAAMKEPGEHTLLLATDDLYIYCPNYSDIDYVAGDRPSKDDESIELCVAAAFQQSYQLDFKHSNIVGWHASDGLLEQGTPKSRLGAFTYVNGIPRIWNIDDAEEAVQKAAAEGGSGYQQFVVLYDGQRGGHDSDEFRCFRVIALLNGEACVIDSRTQMHYSEFISALENLGVRDALYCDMGSGWNYSWYRNTEGKDVDIIGTPWPFSHNWLVFRR